MPLHQLYHPLILLKGSILPSVHFVLCGNALVAVQLVTKDPKDRLHYRVQ